MVRRAREAFARVVRVGVERVAVGPQVSVLVGLIAANLPRGARVVVPTGEFTSVTYPFLVHDDRDVLVEHVPLAGLADAVRPGVDLVAFSLAQSADGTVADADAVLAAAADSGTIVVADLTQAAGWLPVDAGRFDVTVTGAYKWLCAPRGSAFLTVAPHLADRIRPVCAGWYAGESIWASVYGPAMALAGDARRFDTSPAWPVWVGTAPAVELFAGWLDDPATARVVATHGAGSPTGCARRWAWRRRVGLWSRCPTRTARAGGHWSPSAAGSPAGRGWCGSRSTCGTTTPTPTARSPRSRFRSHAERRRPRDGTPRPPAERAPVSWARPGRRARRHPVTRGVGVR